MITTSTAPPRSSPRIFADTSYFLALLVPADAYHEKASAWARNHQSSLLTSEYVLLEVGNFLSPARWRKVFMKFLDIALADARLEIVPGDSALFLSAVALYGNRLDKDWSLTDCSSFVIMEGRGVRDALTADHHFEQAGFNTLLK